MYKIQFQPCHTFLSSVRTHTENSFVWNVITTGALYFYDYGKFLLLSGKIWEMLQDCNVRVVLQFFILTISTWHEYYSGDGKLGVSFDNLSFSSNPPVSHKILSFQIQQIVCFYNLTSGPVISCNVKERISYLRYFFC